MKKPKATGATGPRIIGVTKMVSITEVKPNTWNPNGMTPFMKASLKHGLQQEGWLLSQALTVWGTDEKGRRKNIIINGEHRWTVGNELGFKLVPMCFLNGITESEAKRLTVALNRKRGEHDPHKLGILLRDIQFELPVGDMSLTLGIEQPDLMKLLAEPAVPTPGPEVPEGKGRNEPGADIPASGVKMVQLFFDEAQHREFDKLVKSLAQSYKAADATATVLEAVRRVYRATFKAA
jgi:hypothetical protein